MNAREELKWRCKVAWTHLKLVEESYSAESKEVAMFRARWAALDSSYELVYGEKLEYNP